MSSRAALLQEVMSTGQRIPAEIADAESKAARVNTFAASVVPRALRTDEFASERHRRLKPGGRLNRQDERLIGLQQRSYDALVADGVAQQIVLGMGAVRAIQADTGLMAWFKDVSDPDNENHVTVQVLPDGNESESIARHLPPHDSVVVFEDEYGPEKALFESESSLDNNELTEDRDRLSFAGVVIEVATRAALTPEESRALVLNEAEK